MRNTPQILRVLLLISIYCFGICVSAQTLPKSNTQAFVQNNGQEDYLTTSSVTHFLHTQQSEVSVSVISEYAEPNYKLPFQGFAVISFSNELLFNATFKQYENHFNTLLIRQRKSDLIFPFHNFW